MNVLCVDGGRSGCRLRLRRGTASPIEVTGPALPGVAGTEAVEPILRALDDTLARLRPFRADVVVAGLAGVRAQDELATTLGEALAARTGARRVLVTGDLVSAHAGALRLQPGVVVAAGTGAVAFAVGAEGRAARADGWGPLLGDEGGGFWIARAALASALAHRDGRGGSAALRGRAEALFGPLERLPQTVQRDGEPVATIAGFAVEVAAAAKAGDAVAADLWVQAGRRLACTAAAAADDALVGSRATASYTGGLFAAGELLREPFSAELARRAPHLELRAPTGTALDGAELLASGNPPPGWREHVRITQR